MAVLAQGARLEESDVPAELRQPAAEAFLPVPAHRSGDQAERDVILLPAAQSLRDYEIDAIRLALQAAGGNRRLAAERLGIAARTLYRKMKEYSLS